MITLSTSELLITLIPFFIYGVFIKLIEHTAVLLVMNLGSSLKTITRVFRLEYNSFRDILSLKSPLSTYKSSNYILAAITFLFGIGYSFLSFAYLDGVLRLIPLLSSIIGIITVNLALRRIPEVFFHRITHLITMSAILPFAIPLQISRFFVFKILDTKFRNIKL